MHSVRILQVNVVADRGSTGKICRCIEDALIANGHDTLMCYGRKDSVEKKRRYKFGIKWEVAISRVLNRVGQLMYASSPISTLQLITKIKSWCPDVVHLHCINGYCINIYALLRYLAKEKIPTVITHHAEFYYTGSCSHAMDCLKFTKSSGCNDCPSCRFATGILWCDRSCAAWSEMYNAFHMFDRDKLIFTAVSPWVKARSEMSPIVNGYECVVVENGLDENIFKLCSDRKSARSLVPGCKDKMVLHVTASFSDSSDAFKGGNHVVEMARRLPEVTFVIAASYANVVGSLPDNLYLFGRTKSQTELAALYNAADVTLIASKRETFSMVVAESLCCGTPVVGFRAGGPESIALPQYTEFVEYGDSASLNNALTTMLHRVFNPAEISAEAQRKYSANRMASEYINVYNKILNNGK